MNHLSSLPLHTHAIITAPSLLFSSSPPHTTPPSLLFSRVIEPLHRQHAQPPMQLHVNEHPAALQPPHHLLFPVAFHLSLSFSTTKTTTTSRRHHLLPASQATTQSNRHPCNFTRPMSHRPAIFFPSPSPTPTITEPPPAPHAASPSTPARLPLARATASPCPTAPEPSPATLVQKFLHPSPTPPPDEDLTSAAVRRPIDRGYLINPDLQRDIWHHLFSSLLKTNPCSSSLLLTEPLFALPSIQRATDELVFEDFGFKSLFVADPPKLAHLYEASRRPYGLFHVALMLSFRISVGGLRVSKDEKAFSLAMDDSWLSGT
ncbi:hypothetical protein Tsubulata_020466 [Turnera subulata]|uniref:Uncharacterized protein n=1 Tax=Turnera subulata TaxID=218843 RepID=A0A9Q0GI46_9ROSI|nr:hypothetical protein Tsubulata_020466 [Turnera subulata]